MEMKIVFPGGARVDAEYKGFVVRTDQPVHGGGEGSAPAPFDLFLASLGTCAGVYVLNFLRQRDLPADDVRLELRTSKNGESPMLSEIALEVHLPDDFPQKYARAIVNAVNLCPVKKHMLQPPRFRTAVSIGGEVAAESRT